MTLLSTPLRALAITVLAGLLFAGEAIQAQSTRTRIDTIAVDPGVEVELHAFRGDVNVTTWDRSAVRIHGEIEEPTSESESTDIIQVAHENGTVTVKPNGKAVESPGIFTVLGSVMWGRGEPEGPRTTYSVRVPRDASVTLTLDAADAEVSGVDGDVKLEGVSSSINIRDVDGKVLAGTLSGTVTAEDIGGKLLMGTFSGDLHARLSAIADELHVGSFSGDVKITLPADAAFDLKTDFTWGGSVTSDFPLPDSAKQDDGTIPVGGGGPTVAFESFSGSLVLRAK